ncbi:DUF4364 family protein [Caloramator sp. Dgby_cultured_2]|uniref:DUF4364 family protein n=1 Tax=Caloramator sp. Dgby_cultured_2 TaxID=3029174 RepID=UPI00237EAACF|nr:DUF4364 family protein [Caloramator sp. Dgby_cultured_2]WDU84553.1 DUF4364 family protein [Caloramator sp. Dgby_cultured_2]
MDDYLKDQNIEPENKYTTISRYEAIGNEYFVDIKLLENEKIIFDLRLRTSSLEKATSICENWERNYVTLYEKIIDLLKE